MTLTIPLHTISESNARQHWAKRAKRVKAQRATTCMALRAHPAIEKQRWAMRCTDGLMVTLTRIAPRTLDTDNAAGAMKAVRDGVADALGIKDNDARCRWSYKQRKGKPKEYAVEICIGAFGEIELAEEWDQVLP